MNFLNQKSTERLLSWRTFRQSLEGKSDQEQLGLVAHFWSEVPLINFSIDWDRADSWPTSWELIHEGNFDNPAIAYLMEQTLVLSGWNPDRLVLSYIKDTKYNEQMMILIVDDEYVLNYSWGEVFKLSDIREHILSLIRYRWLENSHVEI